MLALKYTVRWQIAGLMFLVLTLSGAMLPEIPFWSIDPQAAFKISDKGLHIISFTFLAAWFSGQYSRLSYWRIAVGLFAFGALIEIFQSMVNYRSAEWLDLTADAAGIAAGLIIAHMGLGGWSLRLEQWLEQ